MNPENSTYLRLRALFERCMDMPTGQRSAWLDSQHVDTALRIELELMFAADANDDKLLGRDVAGLIEDMAPADETFEAASLVGHRYGAFRLTALLGQGGQGVVYRGERVDGGFAQPVAVKLLRRGLHDAAEHRRFRRERDILVRLETTRAWRA